MAMGDDFRKMRFMIYKEPQNFKVTCFTLNYIPKTAPIVTSPSHHYLEHLLLLCPNH